MWHVYFISASWHGLNKSSCFYHTMLLQVISGALVVEKDERLATKERMWFLLWSCRGSWAGRCGGGMSAFSLWVAPAVYESRSTIVEGVLPSPAITVDLNWGEGRRKCEKKECLQARA